MLHRLLTGLLLFLLARVLVVAIVRFRFRSLLHLLQHLQRFVARPTLFVSHLGERLGRQRLDATFFFLDFATTPCPFRLWPFLPGVWHQPICHCPVFLQLVAGAWRPAPKVFVPAEVAVCCFVSPDLDSPGSDSPDLDSPGLDSPGLDSPGLDSPGLDSPGLDSPGLDSPGFWICPVLNRPALDSSRFLITRFLISRFLIACRSFRFANTPEFLAQCFRLFPNLKLLVGNFVHFPQPGTRIFFRILNHRLLLFDQFFKLLDLSFKILDRFLFVGNFLRVLFLRFLFLQLLLDILFPVLQHSFFFLG